MKADASELPAGAALDALVAVEVMGYQRLPDSVDGIVVHRLYRSPAGIETSWPPPFSTNIVHAWEVVASRYGWRAVLWQTSSAWACVLMPRNAGWTLDIAASDPRRADAETAPLAICRAALAAAKG